MKKHFLVVLAAALALGSCSDNDNENMNPDPQESEVSLDATVTYFPTYENYEIRNVRRYDSNMHIVVDSTFDANDNFISRNIHTYNASNYMIEKKDPNDVTIATAVEEYDAQGRLIAFFNYGEHYQYNYEGNTVSVDQLVSPGAFANIGVFTYNEDGIIEAHTELIADVIASATSLQFSGNTKPVALMEQGITGPMEQIGTFSYYPNTMPAILQKSTVKINNEVLKTLKLESSALLGNYYLQDFTLAGNSFYHSETVFNTEAGLEDYPLTQTVSIQGQPFSYTYYYFQN